MTRINTNVSSLVAQNTLGRSNAALNEALTRLSTGLRINSGKDDPAGLIASENLRSDITSIRKAITNTDRANQVIATADSALGQVSGLLNDIRGLVTEAANTGALSPDQIAANQLQLDSSLEALNRIAQTTTFQGRRLLDGSLDFITTAGTGFGTVANLKIDQANLGSTGNISVNVDISVAATRAQIVNTAIPAGSGGGVAASGTLTFADAGASATGTLNIAVAEQLASGTATIDSTNNATFTLTAKTGGDAAGAEGNGVKSIVIVDDTTEGAVYDDSTNTLTVTVDIANGNDTATYLAGIISAGADFNATGVTNGTDTVTASNVGSGTLAGGQNAGTEVVAITANAGSAGNNLTFAIVEENGVGTTPTVSNVGNAWTIHIDDTLGTSISDIASAIAGITGITSATTSSTASYNPADDAPPGSAATLTGGSASVSDVITVTAASAGTAANGVTISIVEANGHGAATAAIQSGNIVVTVDDAAATSITSIASAINSLAGYNATVTGTAGDDVYVNGTDDSVTGTLANGAAAGGLDSALVFEIAGATGGEVLSFGVGTSLTDIVAAINAVGDATGVAAVDNAGNLELTSTAYGSAAFVSVSVLINTDTLGTFTGGLSATRANGTDIVASVNGIQAKGQGNTVSINTATLDLSLTVVAGSSTDVNFTINGGGALFQLGPDVVSNQQARIGITSVNTARLGGTSGKLFQLGSGGDSDLTSDTTKAAAIVEEAINQITSLRGRLGAFQRTTLETNKNALSDTLVNLTEAESQIRDADFAAETANLTRAQILVQSGTTVLQITNQNPQNVLALLR